MPYYGKAQEAALRLKELIHEIFIDWNPKQQTVAYHGDVKQNTISQWNDPEDDRQWPMFQLFLQPKEFALPICEEVLKRFGKQIVDNVFDLPTDGRVEDNLINVDRIQGAIITKMQTDPKGALKDCDNLLREVTILKKELELKVK